MTSAVRTPVDSAGDRSRQRTMAAAAAVAVGGFASLTMALLGPSAPSAGPPPAVVHRRARRSPRDTFAGLDRACLA